MKLKLAMLSLAALLGTRMWKDGAVLRAQTGARPSGPEVTVTVTVVRRNARAPSTLMKDDVLVYQNHDRRPVVSWTPASARGSKTDLAVLVDDSAGSSFGNQIRDLKNFILSLSPAARVAVAYADYGGATFVQSFTTRHALAAKSLRLPIGRANEGSSIYMAVRSLVKRLPKDGYPHNILLISDGVDLYRGVMDSEPGLNPDLNNAVHTALRAHATVFTLFANGAGLYRRNLFLLTNGQSCLSLLTLETGGESFFQGFDTPVSFRPYLDRLSRLLESQYLLTFTAAPSGKPGMAPVRITTEQPDVQLLAPQTVYVPAS